MAYKAQKTEHTGAKHGRGAYWGPKRDAKQESNTLRRRQGTYMVRHEKWLLEQSETDKLHVAFRASANGPMPGD